MTTGHFTEIIDQTIRRLPDRVKEGRRPPMPAPSLIKPVLPYRTALEVANSTPEQPDWLVRGYVARQAITELDGKIKSAGKTTWMTHLVAAVLQGQPFMGAPTLEANVIYLTEQSQGSFREALRRADLWIAAMSCG